MKKSKFQVLTDANSLTIVGGSECNGTETKISIYCLPGPDIHYDWEDEGCCEDE